jgi:sortase (surface protein transpeptidase)
MKTTHAIAIVLGIVCGIVLFFILPRTSKSFTAPVAKKILQQKPSPSPVPSITPTPTITYSAPVRIRIKKINIDTIIEKVGNDARGRMDVPKGVNNAAWYEPGYKPGMVGSAVIAAHYDTPTGAPGPFFNVSKLEAGDVIETEDVNGKLLKFKVASKQMHKDASFPINEVFARADKPRLNLITCSGTWDKTAKNYSDRLVVYAVLE